MSQIMTDIVIHKRFVDGPDVLTWLTCTPPSRRRQTANWSRVENGKITAIHVTFDARRFAPPDEVRASAIGPRRAPRERGAARGRSVQCRSGKPSQRALAFAVITTIAVLLSAESGGDRPQEGSGATLESLGGSGGAVEAFSTGTAFIGILVLVLSSRTSPGSSPRAHFARL